MLIDIPFRPRDIFHVQQPATFSPRTFPNGDPILVKSRGSLFPLANDTLRLEKTKIRPSSSSSRLTERELDENIFAKIGFVKFQLIQEFKS